MNSLYDVPMAAPANDLSDWVQALLQPRTLVELGVLLACALLAWGAVAGLRRAFAPRQVEQSIWFGRSLVDGVLFPALLLASAYSAHAALLAYMPLAVFRVAIPVLVSLVVIRVGVKVLQVAFRDAAWLPPIERTISWIAWGCMVLWVSGLLPVVLAELEQITWKVGGSTLSVRTMIEGALTAGAVLIVTLWISSAIEARLLRAATGSELSLRKAVSNATRALLMFVGLMMALSAVGIDLRVFSVLGGAIGVGIGFGLQKLAANYVSGFVILTERSVRIGDVVRVDNFEGSISDIKARFTVVRALNGREAIVPNEMLLTQRVESLSLADPRVSQSTVVSVGYDSDVELVSRLLLEAARRQPRVLAEPGPSAALSAFGADGLEFTLSYWIEDPDKGVLGLRSAINKDILASFRAHGIEIPYPQRVMHVTQDEPAAVPPLAPAPARPKLP